MTVLHGGIATATPGGRRASAAPKRVGFRLGSVTGTSGLLTGERARTWARVLPLALGLGAAYALLAWVSIWSASPSEGGSALWPPAGLTLATLLLTPRRTWPVWLAAFAAADFSVNVATGTPVALALAYLLAIVLEPFVGALLVSVSIRRRNGYRARTVAFAIFGVVVAPIVGATIGASASALLEARPMGWWGVVWTWWLGDALGVVVVGSAILTWAHWPVYKQRAPIASLPVIAACATAAGGVVVAAAVVWHDPVVVAALPLLAWAAFAGGPLAVTAIGTAVAAAADWAALTGRSTRLLASASRAHQLAVLQVYLGVTLLTVLILAAEVAERRRVEHLAWRAELERVRSEETAVRLAEAERRSITHDTHDIVGHGLNVVLLQLGAVRRVIDSDPALARELVESAEEIGRRACDDLDVALALARQEPVLKPGLGLAALPELVDALRRGGLRVDLSIEGEVDEIPTLVDWSAYRIVREALTNVAKHAPGATTAVLVHRGTNDMRVSVTDDGGGATGQGLGTDGAGVIGMRERAVALGGTLDAGPLDGGGFAVVATLPVAASAP
jgi:signal transduction histidine kinase